jgi:archaeosine synthase alpha-subunit
MRTVERIEGLALLGSGTVGGLPLRLPGLLDAGEVLAPRDGAVALRSAPASPGARGVLLTGGGVDLPLELPILAPEVLGPSTGVHRLSRSVVLLHAPLDLAALAEVRADPPELAILGNARALWGDGSSLVDALGSIRSNLGAGPILWAPRVALPHRIPLLAYLGVDLVDTTEGLLAAARGDFLDPALGTIEVGAARSERPCDCAACRAEPPGTLADHATAAYDRAHREARTALRAGRLRELAETRSSAEPAAAEQLRYADARLGGLLEERAPVTGGPLRTYVLAESHRRPEMVRFRERLVARYRPPPSKGVLLVVPCSKTKPYRQSPSHRRIARALEDLRGLERVHLVSVSSPIGIVPRELEDLPPARQYDIPVTGHWLEEERAQVLRGLGHLVRHGGYRTAILHLDPEEYGFVGDAATAPLPTVWTAADGRTTSPASLERLHRELETALDALPPVEGGPLAVVREELHEVASVQFGRPAADRLFASPVRLQGRPWFQRLTDGRNDLATLQSERGLYHLTVGGARRMGDAVLKVEVDAGVRLQGDLFVPGVAAADPAIRAGDEVGLFRAGELAAVGEAALPGRLMRELPRGLAVRVRHRDHRPTDTAKTREEVPAGPGPVVEG